VKYIGLDSHKKKIFATVLDGDETILARSAIGTGRDDIYYYLNKIKKEDKISALEKIISDRITEDHNILINAVDKDFHRWF